MRLLLILSLFSATLTLNASFSKEGEKDKAKAAAFVSPLQIKRIDAESIINIQGEEIRELTIIDKNGQVVFKTAELFSDLDISTCKMDAGVYTVKAEMKAGTAIKEIVIR